RRTYATTGQRVYLDFRVNDQLPGSEISITSPPRISVEIAAATVLESIELLRLDRNTRQFTTLAEWQPGTPHFQSVTTDPGYKAAALYYVRAKQKGTVNGRPIYAWSSPVWLR
ncbi:MAG: hypothetical protein GY953_25840, partial [bacterium]|nr:hypothetical protein [bacterium]